jgi:hypothetical protein
VDRVERAVREVRYETDGEGPGEERGGDGEHGDRYAAQQSTGLGLLVASSGSYLAGSCADAPLQVVKNYIENQKRPA